MSCWAEVMRAAHLAAPRGMYECIVNSPDFMETAVLQEPKKLSESQTQQAKKATKGPL